MEVICTENEFSVGELIENNICIRCYDQPPRIRQENLLICTKNCTLHRCTECGYVQETWLVENCGYDEKDIGDGEETTLILEYLGINDKCPLASSIPNLTIHVIMQALKPVYKEWQKSREEDWWQGFMFEGRTLDVNIHLPNTDSSLPHIDIYVCEKDLNGTWETKTEHPILSFNPDIPTQDIRNRIYEEGE